MGSSQGSDVRTMLAKKLGCYNCLFFLLPWFGVSEMLRFLVIFVLFSLVLANEPLDSSSFDTFRSSQSHEEVSAYWTKERMDGAIAKNIAVDVKQVKEAFADVAASSAKFDEGSTIPGKIPERVQFDTKEEVVGNSIAYPFPFTAGYATSYSTYPYSTIGRLYYTQAKVNYVATASVVGKYVAFTSADVVYDSSANAWSTNVYFIPGYNYGSAPFGTFTYYQLFANKQYTNNTLQTYNFALIVLYPSATSGIGVGGLTGTLGFAWNQSYYLSWRVTGYPSIAPFTGNQNYYTDSALGVLDSTFGQYTLGVGNNGTGGIGGSPFVYNWGTNYYVNSVTAYKYSSQPMAVYGPYFGKSAYNLYTSASAIVPPST